MLFDFENHNDKLRVVHDGQWSFDKSLILVADFDDV